MGSAAFKAVVTSDPREAGSIPVHLREQQKEPLNWINWSGALFIPVKRDWNMAPRKPLFGRSRPGHIRGSDISALIFVGQLWSRHFESGKHGRDGTRQNQRERTAWGTAGAFHGEFRSNFASFVRCTETI